MPHNARVHTGGTSRRGSALVLALLLALVLVAVTAGQSLVQPYKHRWDREHQLFARWFWRYGSDGVPMVCLSGDLNRQLFLRFYESPYLVGRDINRQNVPFAKGRDGFRSIPPGTPIDCVAYQQEGHTYDDAQFRDWLAHMERAYELVGKRSYRVMIDDKPGKTAHYHVWRFRPLSPTSHLSQTMDQDVPTSTPRTAAVVHDLPAEAGE